MAEAPTNPAKGEPEAAREPVSWRSHWQAPALLLAVLAMGGGVLTAVLTAPKPNIVRMLDEADQLIHAEKFEQGLEVLNKKLLPYLNAGSLSGTQKREFHLMRARAMYLGQQHAGIDIEENAKTITDEYGEAMKEGELEPRDRFYLANADITLSRYTQALDLAHGLPVDLRAEKGKVIKRVVEGLLAATELDAPMTLRLLAEFLGERELTVGDRGWALARQAELLMRQGLMTSAITKLLQTMPSLMGDLERDQLGELYLLLGRAYFETDALSESQKQLGLATKLLSPTDTRHGSATVLLARIDDQIGDPPEEGRLQARQKFTDVVDRFGTSPARLPALLGLGEVNAALGDTPASLAAYKSLVDAMTAGGRDGTHPDVSVERVTESLMSRVTASFDAGRTDQSLDYAALAERLYPPDAVPSELLAVIAKAHRSAAEALYSGTATGRERLLELIRLDPATREQVRQHLVAAGRYYKRHADRIGINDNTGYGRSLWMAADCFDQAGDSDQSIPLFSDYAKFFPSELQQPEARYRLARAHQARGDYATAEDFYRRLIEESLQSGSGAGPYGDASHVPLAQCYLVDGDPANDAEAEVLLQRVVDGHVGGAGTGQFRESLLELGRLKAGRAEYAAAIQLLNEAATRFPESSQIDGVRYELAEAFRQDARGILKSLSEAMPDARRQAFTKARMDRLERAGELYEQVRKSLEARDPARLSKLEQLQLRNSYFYIADSEFERKDYESAIRHYDAAREKYSKDPASLVAMIQIVNAYVEQGDMKRAATAQERAMRFYKTLPDVAWSDPTLPISKKDWEGWLQSMNALKPIKDAGTAAAAPGGGAGGGGGGGNDGH